MDMPELFAMAASNGPAERQRAAFVSSARPASTHARRISSASRSLRLTARSTVPPSPRRRIADDRTSRPLRQDRATFCRPGWVSAKRRSGREEVSRAASCRDSDARLSARIDAIVTWANTGAKAIRRSPAIRLPRRFFPLLGAQKSAAGTRIKRLDRIRKQLIEIALSQTLLGLDAAFLRIFP